MQIIGHIRTQFVEKFGIPRQSGLVEETAGRIEFEPEFRTPDAFKGLEGYSHIWLLWEFSEAKQERFAATVKPPRLGGNRRMGVFATRSPYRPNPIGLSSVRLTGMDMEPPIGPVLYVAGADLLDGTPIYDIKPYLPYTDSHPDARDGFAGEVLSYRLDVEMPEPLLRKLPEEMRTTVLKLLAEDPRPAYQEDANRSYGMRYGAYDIRFHVKDGTLTVYEIEEKVGGIAKDNA